MTYKQAWIVGGNEIHGFVVSKPHPREGNHSARIWLMKGHLVRHFLSFDAAQKQADKLNEYLT